MVVVHRGKRWSIIAAFLVPVVVARGGEGLRRGADGEDERAARGTAGLVAGGVVSSEADNCAAWSTDSSAVRMMRVGFMVASIVRG